MAVFRGRTLNNAPILKPENITHIGFLTTAALVKPNRPQTFTLSVLDIHFL
jgi:hypothetical protein